MPISIDWLLAILDSSIFHFFLAWLSGVLTVVIGVLLFAMAAAAAGDYDLQTEREYRQE